MTLQSTPIIQFGTSKFLQAHADLFFHEAGLERCVTIIAASGSASGEARLASFGDRRGFPVLIRGREDGVTIDRSVEVRSVAQGLSCGRDWADIQRLVVEDARYILSNTTESGFNVPEGLVVDLDGKPADAPPSYPAKLLVLLHGRYRAGGPGLHILPTELLTRNGDLLKRVVLDLARKSGAEDGFLDWIDQDCVFVNSLVDRIVSEALEPVGAIAEPYALWAVEAQARLEMPCAHPSIVVFDDLEKIQRLKLHILNLGHTFLGELHLREGRDENETVYAMLSDPAIRSRLTSVYEAEVLPCFALRGMGEEARDYKDKTMERFLNAFLDHRMAFVVKDHRTKVARRIGDFLQWATPGEASRMAPELAAIAARYQ